MKISKVKIGLVKPNPNNPRVIKDDKFQKLVNSIKEFPEMLEIRPIVVDGDMQVLGGNMRLRACQEAGLKEVFICNAGNLTPEQQKEFAIKDNVSYGEWDWDALANEWETVDLEEWGLNIPNFSNVELFEVDDKEEEKEFKPSATDDNYSVFELVMLHENKIQLIETLNKIKNEFLFEKQEDAIMELVRIYNK